MARRPPQTRNPVPCFASRPRPPQPYAMAQEAQRSWLREQERAISCASLGSSKDGAAPKGAKILVCSTEPPVAPGQRPGNQRRRRSSQPHSGGLRTDEAEYEPPSTRTDSRPVVEERSHPGGANGGSEMNRLCEMLRDKLDTINQSLTDPPDVTFASRLPDPPHGACAPLSGIDGSIVVATRVKILRIFSVDTAEQNFRMALQIEMSWQDPELCDIIDDPADRKSMPSPSPSRPAPKPAASPRPKRTFKSAGEVKRFEERRESFLEAKERKGWQGAMRDTAWHPGLIIDNHIGDMEME